MNNDRRKVIQKNLFVRLKAKKRIAGEKTSDQTLTPESLIKMCFWQVFWLIRFLKAFPFRKEQWPKFFKKLAELQLRVQLPNFTGFPLHCRQMFVCRQTNKQVQY